MPHTVVVDVKLATIVHMEMEIARGEQDNVLAVGVLEARHKRYRLVEEDGSDLDGNVVDLHLHLATIATGNINEECIVGHEHDVLLFGLIHHTEGIRCLHIFHHRLHIRRRVKADPVQIDLGLVGSQIEDRQIIILHNTIALREGVTNAHLFQVLAGNFAEVTGNDDAELAIAFHLVVIHLHRLVDVAERHVNLDKKYIALIVGIRIEHPNELELSASKIQILVDKKFVGSLIDELFDSTARNRIGRILPIELVNKVGHFHLQFLCITLVL
mmetsp:Transcript_21151/g.60676  ORF Transcript_21151/g.60676 Transcript_21151/m.60676 type:complete len:271 (-) Transcript_21151:610-1422(-)